MENTSAERIQQLVAAQRAFFATGATRSVKWRLGQLEAFGKGLKKWEKALCDALWEEFQILTSSFSDYRKSMLKTQGFPGDPIDTRRAGTKKAAEAAFFVTRLGLEPKTPALKVLCSTN